MKLSEETIKELDATVNLLRGVMGKPFTTLQREKAIGNLLALQSRLIEQAAQCVESEYKQALQAIAEGDGDAQEIAKQTLGYCVMKGAYMQLIFMSVTHKPR